MLHRPLCLVVELRFSSRSKTARIEPQAVVPCVRKASSLALSGGGTEMFIRMSFTRRPPFTAVIHKCIISYLVVSNGVCLPRAELLHFHGMAMGMAKKDRTDHHGTLNIRGIPKDLIFRMKMAAAAERRTVKGFLLALAEERIQELEKKGLLPKGK